MVILPILGPIQCNLKTGTLLAFLHGVSPVEIRNLRCRAAFYDMGVQQGSLKKAHNAIKRRVVREQPEDEFALTRRHCILDRKPVSISLDGQRARRSNRSSYLLRDSGVKGLDRYLAG